MCFVIVHQVGIGLFRCPASVNHDVPVSQLWRFQTIVHPHVVAAEVILEVVAVADIEGAVGILVEKIVQAGLTDVGLCMIISAVPIDMFDTECGMTGIEDLKLPVFVAAVEDQFPLMLPLVWQ